MKTGGEGANVLLGWFTNGAKWLKDHSRPDSRVQGIFTKKETEG